MSQDVDPAGPAGRPLNDLEHDALAQVVSPGHLHLEVLELSGPVGVGLQDAIVTVVNARVG